MSDFHKPRPTEFDGIKFRSKSEAMFAASLTKIGFCNNWIYEPQFLAVDEWVVDFAIPTVSDHGRFCWHPIEYKPKRPTDTYLEELAGRFGKLTQRGIWLDAWCVWIDWYNLTDAKRWDWGALRLADGKFAIALGGYYTPTIQVMWPFWNSYPREFEAITKMRFDLVEASR